MIEPIDLAVEVQTLRAIIHKAKSPMWWARLSYADDARYWTDDEQTVLARVANKDLRVDSDGETALRK